MERFYLLDGLEVKIEMESVLHAIDCGRDNPVYEEMVNEYREICPEMLSLAEPIGILGIGSLSERVATQEYPAGTKVIYAVTGIGNQISRSSTKAFREGDYVRGMMCDAMADCALFSLEQSMLEKLREVCAEHKVGILKRLEAPHDISMEVQREAWEYLELQKRFGIEISCGYMFDPVKTSCQVFVLTADVNVFKAQHDCRKCSNLACKLRNIPKAEITVQKGKDTSRFFLEEGESLMNGLLREGHYISAVCGGTGRCGKCKVRILKGEAPVGSDDAICFSREELEAGWRLSCRLFPKEDLVISFELDDETSFAVVSEYEKTFSVKELSDTEIAGWRSREVETEDIEDATEGAEDVAKSWHRECEIAIDIGTTTIAFQLLDKKTGEILNTVTAVNSQRKYGADVISRMQASVDGKKNVLQECIKGDLQNGIREILQLCGAEVTQLVRIVVGCNTTMGHLLMGYDCDSLGVYPFTPVNIKLVSGSMEEILGMSGSAEVVLLPGISTFVGGDIVSGLYACEFDRSDEICLLVDLGTNGEMALGNRSGILTTSTAAGPAFEGGNISWGIGSVAGAICSVELEGVNATVQTIGDRKPVGICGTGVVEAIAEMLHEELLDETGLLAEEYFEKGFPISKTVDGRAIVLTQKDIRELQLAKAAIRAGVETLVRRYGIQKEQVSKVYLAGGFGYRLNAEKAIAIGMLPEEFAGRIQAVGNGSLAGAVKYLREPQGKAVLEKLVEISDEINLSMDKDFNEAYMEYMMFV